jgi:hypothetical protein
MIKNDRRLWALGFLFMGFWFLDFWGCNKTDHPFGVNAPFGLDIPTLTPTPSTGAFNCYVYDGIPNAGGSPKQGVTIVLLDPAGNTVAANYTDQFGNALFNPNPLYTGVYNAVVQKQDRYGISTLPITVVSLSQGPASILFWDASQALSIIGGAPISFTTGSGSFPLTLFYDQPGTLDVPVTVTANSLPSAWLLNPIGFSMGMAVSIQAVTITKVSCSAFNQPVTWNGKDLLSNSLVSEAITLYRSFPVSLVLSKNASGVSCAPSGIKGQCIFNLTTTSDCGMTWSLSATCKRYLAGAEISSNSYVTSISNSNSVTVIDTSCLVAGYPVSWKATVSSPIGNASSSSFGNGSGTVISTAF